MNRLAACFLCVFAMTVSLCALAQPQGGASSSEGAAAQVDKVFALFDKPNSPGCALAVIKDGQIVYKTVYRDGDHAVGEAGQTLARRQGPKIHRRVTRIRPADHHPPSAASHQRAARSMGVADYVGMAAVGRRRA